MMTYVPKVGVQTPSRRNTYFEIFARYTWTWVIGVTALVIYCLLLYAVYVPDCGMAQLGPSCNSAQMIDKAVEWMRVATVTLTLDTSHQYRCYHRQLFGVKHMYKHPTCGDMCHHEFEPEGVVGTFTSVVSLLLGLHAGRVCRECVTHRERLLQWVPYGIALWLLGMVLNYSGAVPFNKKFEPL